MTGKRYLIRKRILGISAIVLALLLIAVPGLGYARNTNETQLLTGPEIRNTIRSLYNGYEGALTSIEWNEFALDSETVISQSGETYPVYIRMSDDHSKLFVYSEADIIYANANCQYMFSDSNDPGVFENLESIDSEFMTRLNTSAVTDMYCMFHGCPSLTGIDLSSFDTSGVTNFTEMFSGCTELEDITFGSGFNTDSAAHLESMFKDCSSLAVLNTNVLTRVTPDNIGNGLNHVFSGCSSLERIDLRDFVYNGSSNEYTTDILTDCTSLKWIGVSKSVGWSIYLPFDDFVVDNGDGTYGETSYSQIPTFAEDSQAYIRRSVIPTPTAEATQAAEASPTAEVSPTAGVTQSAGTTPTPTATPTPTSIVTPTVAPTPTQGPTQVVRNNSLTIVDNRADKTGTNQIAASVSNLVGNLKLIIEDDDGADIKKIQALTKDQTLVSYNIYIIDENGNRYNNFGSCTITMPVPSSMDLTTGDVKVVAALSNNVLENVSTTKVVKNNINCIQFTATAFGEYGFLYTPKSAVTGAVTSPTPSVTTSPTPSATKSATPKPSTTKGASGGSSGSSDKKDSSSSSSSSKTAKPVAGVKGYSNAKDMPKTGDGDAFRILGAVILFLFGSIELISSIRENTAE